MKLIDDFLLDQISEEYCELYRNLHRDELTNKVRKAIENIFLKFREYSKEEILKALIVFSLFEPDYCIKLARRKGVFRYSERGGYATYYMMELLKHKKYLFFSDNTISYIENKLDNRWMQEYYIKSEEKLNKEILKHYQKRIRKNICGKCFETSLILELMSCMEIIFRTNCAVASKQVKNRQLFRDRIEGFSQEEISEAISYLIYLVHEMNPIKKNRILWLDTNYVNSLNIVDLILEACKRNQLIEWEVMIDYLGYSINREGEKICIQDASVRMEKSIRLGYIKQQMQEQIIYQKFMHDEEEGSLKKLAMYLVDEIGEKLFVLKKEHAMIERYQFQFPSMLLDAIVPKEKDNPRLFTEEFDYVCLICREQMISMEEFYHIQVTEHCTAIDVIMFKRFFTLFVIMQNYLWKNKLYENKENISIIERSVIPAFEESKLISLITSFLKSEEKSRELLELMTWNGKEKLDLQYTPILKLADQYFLAVDICVVSNSFRNIIVKARSRNNQIVNSDGQFNPLERKCEECFRKSKFPFKYNKGLTYEYKGRSGEIDFLGWTDDSLYIFECKNVIIPTSTFELRTTYEYIEKAEQQLNLSQDALSDLDFRKRYFKSWNISNAESTRNVITCILLGNRIFSTYSMGKHPIRYIYELDMVLNSGIIKSQIGIWRYWMNEDFSEDDLKLFLSEEDKLTNSMLDAMSEYHEYITYMKKQVEFISFMFNSYEASKCQDKNFEIISKNETLITQIQKDLDSIES